MISEQENRFPNHDCGTQFVPVTLRVSRNIDEFRSNFRVPGVRCQVCEDEYIDYEIAEAIDMMFSHRIDRIVGHVITAEVPQILLPNRQCSNENQGHFGRSAR